MKFTLDRTALADAVAWAYSNTLQKGTMPILAALHLEVDGAGRLSVSGFDYDSSGQTTVDVDDAEPGQVLVPGRLLSEIVKALPSAPVEVSHEDGATRLTVACRSSRFQPPVLPLEDYPTLPKMPSLLGTVEAMDLVAAIKQVSVIKPDQKVLAGMPVLAAINVTLGPKNLSIMTTDRYRFALKTIPWEPQSTELDAELLIPADFLAGFQRGYQGTDPIGLAAEIKDGLVMRTGLSTERVRGVSRVLGGDYLKVLAVMKKYRTAMTATAITDREDLREALNRTTLVLNQLQSVWMTFTADEVVISAENEDNGAVMETLPVKTEGLDGEEMRVKVNPLYLANGLAALDADLAYLSLMGHAKPMIITSAPLSDPALDFHYMLMTTRDVPNKEPK